jgi:hypothetical protein
MAGSEMPSLSSLTPGDVFSGLAFFLSIIAIYYAWKAQKVLIPTVSVRYRVTFHNNRKGAFSELLDYFSVHYLQVQNNNLERRLVDIEASLTLFTKKSWFRKIKIFQTSKSVEVIDPGETGVINISMTSDASYDGPFELLLIDCGIDVDRFLEPNSNKLLKPLTFIVLATVSYHPGIEGYRVQKKKTLFELNAPQKMYQKSPGSNNSLDWQVVEVKGIQRTIQTLRLKYLP